MRTDTYTAKMAEKLVAKMRSNPSAIFNALGTLEEKARQEATALAARGDHSSACVFAECARIINVCREWCPSW